MKVKSQLSKSTFWVAAACLTAYTLALPLHAQNSASTPPAQPTQAAQPEVQGTPAPETATPPSTQPPPQAPARDTEMELEVNEHARTFKVHLPQGYDSQQRYPVVLLLHGVDQDATEMARITHFSDFADGNGIIAVYPNALHGRWNLGGGEQRPNRRDPYRRPGPGYSQRGPRPEQGQEGAHRNPDIQFMNRLLDKLRSRYSVDTRRIYAAGLGEGGFLAIRMGCHMADRLAAVAIVGAAMPRMLNCEPSRPISAILMNGTDDPVVPYDGGRYKDGMLHLFSADESVREWARADRCAEKPTESKLPALQEGGRDTRVLLFSDCQEGSQVALYSVPGGGHTWPGGESYSTEKEVGKTSQALNANETIWGFLFAKKISGESGTER